jgi:2Fe-2S ferredoxin
MVQITYIESNGTTHIIDVKPGLSVMQAATGNRVPGIVAECGGNCACGTCCIYVDEGWREKTGRPSDMENATMEIRDDPTPGRRLSCQVKVTEELDGLIVRLPESQF